MNLQEMFEAAKAKWPGKTIVCGHYLDNSRDNETWYYLCVRDKASFDGPSQIGDTPEECFEKIVIPDRVAQARKMIEDANKILDEEGVLTKDEASAIREHVFGKCE